LSSVHFRRPKPLNQSTNGLQPLPHEKGQGLRRSARCCGRVSLWLIIRVHPETHRIASCHNRLLPCVTLKPNTPIAPSIPADPHPGP
jgi:hypothetical protein